MQRGARADEQFIATCQLEAMKCCCPVGEAATRRDQPTVVQLPRVVGGAALWLVRALARLDDGGGQRGGRSGVSRESQAPRRRG